MAAFLNIVARKFSATGPAPTPSIQREPKTSGRSTKS